MKSNFILTIGIGMTMLIFDAVPAIAKPHLNFNFNLGNNYSLDLDWALPLLMSQKIAQTLNREGNAEEIIRPGKHSTNSLDLLDSNANPLSLPTRPEEVEVDVSEPITLEQALELSLKNNQDIVEARIEIEQSRFALRQERAALFPTLNFNGNFAAPNFLNYQNSGFLDNIPEQEAEGGIPPDNEQSAITENRFGGFGVEIFDFGPALELAYDIYDGGERGALIRIAEKQLRSIELGLEIVAEEILLETAQNYYALQNGDASVEIAEAAVTEATRTLSDAQFSEEAGVATRFDVIRARTQLAETEQTLVTAIADREISRQQLAETLSLRDNVDVAAADPVEPAGAWELSLPESIILAYQNRAELEQFLLQREIAQEQRTVSLSQIRPTITASAAYALLDNFEDNFDIIDEYSLGLNIRWQLFDGGAARTGAQQAEKDAEIAETQFANQRNEIDFAVKQAYLQLESNLNNIDTATQEVELAEASLEMARLRFQEGIGTQTDVIDAQTQLTTARDRLLSSVIVYNQSLADLRRQVSNTLNDRL